MRAGLEQVWPYTAELFDEDDLTDRLVAAGELPPLAALRTAWQASVAAVLDRAGLTVPCAHVAGARRPAGPAHRGVRSADRRDADRCAAQFPGGTW
ncbi:Phenylacetate-CoA oxygenase subunit PaaC OS=Streptomyces tendae OX=1932 GN=paaC PE=4 SV=1 [Streptomyces tendae]